MEDGSLQTSKMETHNESGKGSRGGRSGRVKECCSLPFRVLFPPLLGFGASLRSGCGRSPQIDRSTYPTRGQPEHLLDQGQLRVDKGTVDITGSLLRRLWWSLKASGPVDAIAAAPAPPRAASGVEQDGALGGRG